MLEIKNKYLKNLLKIKYEKKKGCQVIFGHNNKNLEIVGLKITK